MTSYNKNKGLLKDFLSYSTDIRLGNFETEVFKNGINADRDATDYKREVIKVFIN